MVAVAGRSKGCVTCRKRKVKCDLAKPSCGNCIRLKFTCGGYDRYPVFIRRTIHGPEKTAFLDEVKDTNQNHSKLHTGSFRQPSFSGVQGCSPVRWQPAGVQMNQETWLHYRFFNQYTVVHITNGSDSYFWKQLIPELCQTQPAILNIALALASVHRSWQPCLAWQHLPQPSAQDAFAMTRVLEASRHLAALGDDPAKPLIEMVSSLLLIAMELLQGHGYSAYMRIQQGVRIRHRWQQNRSLAPSDYDSTIQHYVAPIFTSYTKRVHQGVMANAANDTEEMHKHVDNGDLCVAVASQLVKPN